MNKGLHDTLVYRLSQTLIKLNQGQKLNPRDLADEFGVNLRTIQRDLNVRFAYLPLEKKNGLYFLEPYYLGKLSSLDVERFASLAGVNGLFPQLTDDFLKDIFYSSSQTAFQVHGHNYENTIGKEVIFAELEKAINHNSYVSFSYNTKSIVKVYSKVEPYKLLNNKGIWYLACVDKGKLKTFGISKINNLKVGEDTFIPNPEQKVLIDSGDTVWLDDESIEVILKIDACIANYFKRRDLLSQQKLIKTLEDGSLILSTQMTHTLQLLPIIRYWIPHIRIISPESIQDELDKGLTIYLNI